MKDLPGKTDTKIPKKTVFGLGIIQRVSREREERDVNRFSAEKLQELPIFSQKQIKI